MKGIYISSCASQASTAIYSSMEQYPPSSSSSSVVQSSAGGQAIDRHNPIITDSRRATTTLGTPCKSQTPQKPKNNQKNIQHKSSRSDGTTKKKNKKSRRLVDLGRKKINGNKDKINGNKDGGGNNYQVKKSINVSKPSDFMLMKGCSVKPGDYISPPESSRYLLHNDNNNNFSDVLSDFDHGLKLVPCKSKKDDVHGIKKVDKEDSVVAVEKADNSKVLKPTTSSTSTSSTNESSHHDQVVVLRVSLHCKGCERKMRKHISRMEGVTSFDIDFAAKKVTVVGDVTPLGVLVSISKVMKNVQLWTTPPQLPTAMHVNDRHANIIT